MKDESVEWQEHGDSHPTLHGVREVSPFLINMQQYWRACMMCQIRHGFVYPLSVSREAGRYVVLVLLLVGSGCSRAKNTDPTSMMISPGVGISNVLARGMTYRDMKKATGDMVVIAYPSIRMPWQREGCNPNTRMVWDKPDCYDVTVPSLGASLLCGYGWRNGDPHMGYIDFSVTRDTDPPNMRYIGSISGGISFANGNVTRDEVVSLFGDPRVCIDQRHGLDTNYYNNLNLAIDFSARFRNNEEKIVYPTRGIIFSLKNDIIRNIRVFAKRTEGMTGTWEATVLRAAKSAEIRDVRSKAPASTNGLTIHDETRWAPVHVGAGPFE